MLTREYLTLPSDLGVAIFTGVSTLLLGVFADEYDG